MQILSFVAGTLFLVRVDANSGGNYSCSTHTSNTAVVTINIVDGQFLWGDSKSTNYFSSYTGERVPEAMVEEKLNIHNSSTSSGYSPVICVINMVALSVTYLVTLNLHPSNKPATWSLVTLSKQKSMIGNQLENTLMKSEQWQFSHCKIYWCCQTKTQMMKVESTKMKCEF